VIPRKRTMRRILRHRVYRGFERSEKADTQSRMDVTALSS